MMPTTGKPYVNAGIRIDLSETSIYQGAVFGAMMFFVFSCMLDPM